MTWLFFGQKQKSDFNETPKRLILNCIIISLEKTGILLFCCPFLKLLPWNKYKRYSSVAKYLVSVQVFLERPKRPSSRAKLKTEPILGHFVNQNIIPLVKFSLVAQNE